ncbi:MAG TPA: YqeG family HAD IIIA-type phosphatase [Clostridia bacterium]|nr:YqeG family HAD IIIA-type phosphatase [Clostridia bacterium]
MKKLIPNMQIKSIYEIDFKHLKEQGILLIICDLDNTLVEWRSMDIPEKLSVWIKELKHLGFKVCIVSNNNIERVGKFAQGLDVLWFAKAGKPLTRTFHLAIKQAGVKPEQTVVIGDQIFTDILGGNCLGARTILVTPISKREFLGTRVMRKAEKLVIAYLRKKGKL